MNDLLLLQWLIVAIMGGSAGLFWGLMRVCWDIRPARWVFGLWATVVTGAAFYLFLLALGVFIVGPVA